MSKEISITITPTWAIIEHVRKRIKNELSGVVDKTKMDAAIICASELCENAIKYGDSVSHMLFIQFFLKCHASSVVITVANGVTNPQDKKNAMSTIDKINQSGNPEQLYVNRLKELMDNARPQKSQLGLYRIAHETSFLLSYSEKPDSITITATLNLPGKGDIGMNTEIHGALQLLTSKQAEKLTVSFLGRSDTREPAHILNPFFNGILKDLPGELTLEFDKLEFMNSSSIPPLAQFLDALEKKGTKTIVTYDGKTKWQEMTFGVLKKIAESFKHVSFIPK